MSEALNAGESTQETPKSEENKKAFKDYAGDMGTTIKTATGKVCSVVGGIGLHSVLTVLAVFIGFMILDFIGMGLFGGAALAASACLLLAYVGNGMQGGTWNPLEYAGKAFA